MNQKTTGALKVGAASYPPNYNATGAHLDRALRRYIHGRVTGSIVGTAVGRLDIETAIQRAERGV